MEAPPIIGWLLLLGATHQTTEWHGGSLSCEGVARVYYLAGMAIYDHSAYADTPEWVANGFGRYEVATGNWNNHYHFRTEGELQEYVIRLLEKANAHMDN